MIFYLHPRLHGFFTPEKPLFDQVMSLSGTLFRHQNGRLTQRILLGERTYFIKQHFGVGYKEILKNIGQGRLPIVSAKNEWTAIQQLQMLKIDAPVVVGYGKRGWNPATMQSFVLMEELTSVTSLETLCKPWRIAPPPFKVKQATLHKVAEIAKKMHAYGMNHRDFYICHFLLNQEMDKCYLIDLHRADLRARRRTRWIIKDLAGLFFSSMDIGLTKRDLFRFMKYYRQQKLRDVLNEETQFWQKVQWRGEKLYRDHNG